MLLYIKCAEIHIAEILTEFEKNNIIITNDFEGKDTLTNGEFKHMKIGISTTIDFELDDGENVARCHSLGDAVLSRIQKDVEETKAKRFIWRRLPNISHDFNNVLSISCRYSYN